MYDLEKRTTKFGEDIIDLCKRVEKNVITTPIIGQVVRSGTSIGANYHEANGASSKKDFMNKSFICKKEAKETEYWLRMLIKADKNVKNECERLLKEVHELTLIFGKITSKR